MYYLYIMSNKSTSKKRSDVTSKVTKSSTVKATTATVKTKRPTLKQALSEAKPKQYLAYYPENTREYELLSAKVTRDYARSVLAKRLNVSRDNVRACRVENFRTK